MSNIVIDSVTYNIPMKIVNRSADMLYLFADRTANGTLQSGLIGVYYNYDVQFAQSLYNTTVYAALWLVITAPVVSHSVTMPNESGTLTFDAYFAQIKDELSKEQGGTNYFRNLSFSILAISPARTP